MAVSYKRLWKLLVDKEMSKSDLRKKAEIAPNTMTKLRRDEEVSLTILSKSANFTCRFWGYCGVCAGCRNMGFV